MIRVLMCGNHPKNKGGMTSVISQICNHDWEKNNISMDFIPTYMPGNIVSKMAYFVFKYIKILTLIAFNKYDVVHLHMSYKGSFTRTKLIHKLCLFFRVPDIIHLHGSEFQKWYMEVSDRKQKEIREILSECGLLIVLGDNWKKIIEGIESTTKIFVISNGIDIPEVSVGWNEEFCNVLYLGVFIQRKGLTDLLKAVKRLKDSNAAKHFKIILAGSGKQEDELKNLVMRYQLENLIEFTGWVYGEEKERLLRTSQIFVLPSYNEGLPVSVLEAASYGMPIVATDVGDISSVVRDGINGFLVEPGDIEELVKALLKVSDKRCFESMSKASKKIIREEYSLELFYERLLTAYREVVKCSDK